VFPAQYWTRAATLGCWAWLVWLLLTWTATVEQLIFGGVLAALCGLAMAPLGSAVAPWSLLVPRRLVAALALAGYTASRIVRANVSLARRVWAPSRPLASGLVIVSTRARTDGELAATGVLTSLIVDNQVVDLDRSERVLLYHAIGTPPAGERQRSINAPVEARVARVSGSG
jgi:multicomponent Na+:H+ antiporter subunit E